MLDGKGFDLWADGYDQAVNDSDASGAYPFAGYKKVIESIFQTVMEKQNAAVLDVGFGTGALAARLYENGCAVYGQDFSSRMLEIASAKMPGARLYQGDLARGLAEPLRRESYDFIVATYSLHHLTDEKKIALLDELRERLKENGQILIGDVAFATRAELNLCRQAAGAEWDEDEIYFVADELKRAFPGLSFTRVSPCAGILKIAK